MLTAFVWASNRKVLVFNAGFDPRKNAIGVEYITADTEAKYFQATSIRNQRVETYLAHIACFVFTLPFFNLFENVLLHCSFCLFLHLAFYFFSSLYILELALLLQHFNNCLVFHKLSKVLIRVFYHERVSFVLELLLQHFNNCLMFH